MADEQQLAVLRQGPDAWNTWRQKHPGDVIDFRNAELSYANLCGANLCGADFREADVREAKLCTANLRDADLCKADLWGADFREADLREAKFYQANLSRAKLSGADLSGASLSGVRLFMVDLRAAKLERAHLSGATFEGADLRGAILRGAFLNGADLRGDQGITDGADLRGADLRGAELQGADLREADFREADLRGVDFRGARLDEVNLGGADLSGSSLELAVLVGTKFADANLTGCRVYGMSAWDLHLEGAIQANLIITKPNQPEITVDNLEVAQFIYLLLNNERIRHVIDTITSKVVLILGRFTPERKAVLDELRDALRQRDYLPVLFDFDKPASKDLTGTVQTLANMARFIIADLTDPSCIPHELAILVPSTVVPVQPILLEGQHEYAMFVDLKRRHHWVLEPHCYTSPERLIVDLTERVIAPAEDKARELQER
jgi:uncharacterized protein YjbI with pentapeptide repeats